MICANDRARALLTAHLTGLIRVIVKTATDTEMQAVKSQLEVFQLLILQRTTIPEETSRRYRGMKRSYNHWRSVGIRFPRLGSYIQDVRSKGQFDGAVAYLNCLLDTGEIPLETHQQIMGYLNQVSLEVRP